MSKKIAVLDQNDYVTNIIITPEDDYYITNVLNISKFVNAESKYVDIGFKYDTNTKDFYKEIVE